MCKQHITYQDRLVRKCLQHIISRCYLFRSKLVRVNHPSSPVTSPRFWSWRITNKAWVRFHHNWLKCGNQICLLAYILSSLINLISEACIKGASIKDERIMYLICYIQCSLHGIAVINNSPERYWTVACVSLRQHFSVMLRLTWQPPHKWYQLWKLNREQTLKSWWMVCIQLEVLTTTHPSPNNSVSHRLPDSPDV